MKQKINIFVILGMTFLLSSYSDFTIYQPYNNLPITTSTTDLTINTDTTWTGGQTYEFNSLNIASGKNLTISSDSTDVNENATVIKVKGTLNIDGNIIATKGTHGGGIFSSTVLGITFKKQINQSNGGVGGASHDGPSTCTPGSQAYGNGGGGGSRRTYSCGSSATFYSSGNGISDYGYYGGTSIYGNNGSTHSCNLSLGDGGAGGGGGTRGNHGGLLIIFADKITGNGLIDVHGSNGGNGGNGCCVGGGGGGGAGGSGGVVWFVSNRNSFKGSINLAGGSGGNGGTSLDNCGYPGYSGGNGQAGAAGSVIMIHVQN